MACIGHLQRNSRSCDFPTAAYCFMPDHVHVLVYGDVRAVGRDETAMREYIKQEHEDTRLDQLGLWR